MNNNKFKILSDLKLIVENYTGLVSMEAMINLKKEICLQHNYSPNYNVIMDFRDANLVFTTSEIADYVEFARNSTNILGERRTGFLTSKPNEVVLTTIFGLTKGDLPIESDTFSTLDALVSWLGLLPGERKIVSEELGQLKQNVLC